MSVETLQHSNGGSKVLGFSGSKRLRQGWMSRHDEATDRLLGPPDTGSANCLGGGGGGDWDTWLLGLCRLSGRWKMVHCRFAVHGGPRGRDPLPKNGKEALTLGLQALPHVTLAFLKGTGSAVAVPLMPNPADSIAKKSQSNPRPWA